jgi:hypothetical protein
VGFHPPNVSPELNQSSDLIVESRLERCIGRKEARYPFGPEPGVTSSVAPSALGLCPIFGFELWAMARCMYVPRRNRSVVAMMRIELFVEAENDLEMVAKTRRKNLDSALYLYLANLV